jgi:hypothetical protein
MLHEKTVEPGTLGLLKDLMRLPELEQFRLVGGTALSLFYGHRTSIDLDLFTDQPFDRNIILEKLIKTYPRFSFVEEKGPRLFFTKINDVKVDFVHTFERFIDKGIKTDDIRFASIEEIIALKVNAIAGRFWDLHELLNHYSFDDMFSAYHKRYPQNALMMVAKSMTYFVEADHDIDPHTFKNITWNKIKKDIQSQFNNYIKNK